MKTIVSVIGTRPQFIKVAPIAYSLHKRYHHILIHTGQHYDYQMSRTFFKELDIPKPEKNLGIASTLHGEQTGRMLIRLEQVLLKEKPNLVIIYGDTNSTLAGALAASKLHIPVAHIEAGMRSYNKMMPEEQNRIIADHLSDICFCSSSISANNLRKENIKRNIYIVGDVMLDTLRYAVKKTRNDAAFLKSHKLALRGYILVTVHRAGNVDHKERLASIVNALNQCNKKVVFPVHPRTRNNLKKFKLLPRLHKRNILLLEPVSYMNMLKLEKSAEMILTDSGGVKKEAYFLKTPCVTLREETEWVETVKNGWNTLVGTNTKTIVKIISGLKKPSHYLPLYGNGKASAKITNVINRFL